MILLMSINASASSPTVEQSYQSITIDQDIETNSAFVDMVEVPAETTNHFIAVRVLEDSAYDSPVFDFLNLDTPEEFFIIETRGFESSLSAKYLALSCKSGGECMTLLGSSKTNNKHVFLIKFQVKVENDELNFAS